MKNSLRMLGTHVRMLSNRVSLLSNRMPLLSNYVRQLSCQTYIFLFLVLFFQKICLPLQDDAL